MSRRFRGGPRGRVLLCLVVIGAALAGTGANEPASARPPILLTQSFLNVAYAAPVPVTTKGNLLDLYLPERRADQPPPLFIYTEGSGWQSDQGKVSGSYWAARLLPLGYAVAGVSVRNTAQVTFPGQLHDIKAAIRFLRANAGKYAIDPNRFAVAGASSGGWNALMAGVANDVGVDLEGTEGVTGVSSRVQAVVPIMAPTAFRLADSQATAYSVLVASSPDSPQSLMTGCTAYPTGVSDPACTNAERANPLNYVTPDDPPLLIFQTDRDQLVPPGQAQVLYDALADDCVETEYHLVNGPDHTYGYLANPGAPLVTGQHVQKVDHASCHETSSDGITPATAPSFALVAAFLERTMGRAAAPVLPPVTARLTPRSASSMSARLSLTVAGGDDTEPTHVSVASSNRRALSAEQVYVSGTGSTFTLSITPGGRDTGRTTLSVVVTRGSQSVTQTLTVVMGTGKADVLRGTSGTDVLFGDNGADELLGLSGDDLLTGGSGDDRLLGGSGDDVLVGGAGTDRVTGGAGDDTTKD